MWIFKLKELETWGESNSWQQKSEYTIVLNAEPLNLERVAGRNHKNTVLNNFLSDIIAWEIIAQMLLFQLGIKNCEI